MDTTFVTKLPLNQTDDKFLIVESKWLVDEITIKILEYDCNLPPKEWYGTFYTQEIQNTCEALERPYDEFFAECKKALCHPNGLKHFIYTIDKGKFIWKKDTGGTGTKIIYDMCSQLREKLDSKELQIAELDLKHRQCLEKYEEYVIQKTQHDDELMKKFLVLLNNKKAKIAELKELLYEKKSGQDNSLLLTQSDVEQNSPLTDDEIVVRDVLKVNEAEIQTQINDDAAFDSSQSQELIYKIPKRKQPDIENIEKTVKVRIEEEIGAVDEKDNEFDVDTQVYNVDTLLEDM